MRGPLKAGKALLVKSGVLLIHSSIVEAFRRIDIVVGA